MVGDRRGKFDSIGAYHRLANAASCGCGTVERFSRGCGLLVNKDAELYVW